MRSGWRCRVPGTGRTAEGCRSFRRLRFLSGKLCNQSIALEVLRLEPLASNSGHAFGRKIRECGHRGHRITRFSCAISLKFKFHSFFFLCNVCVRLVPWKKKLQNIWCIFSHFPIFGCLRIMLPCTWQLLLSTWNVWREMHYNSHCCAIRLLSALL